MTVHSFSTQYNTEQLRMCKNCRYQGRLVSPMYWFPKFLVVVFNKQEISQQVVTRMQDLASEFSNIFRGWYPWTLTAAGGDTLPHPTPSPAFDRARGTSTPMLGLIPPQLFSCGCTPEQFW